MRFTDFLKATVLLTAGEATALGAVTVVAAGAREDSVTILFSLTWWAVAAVAGIVIGRRMRPTTRIAALLSQASSSTAVPEVQPGTVLVNRLWPLAVSALLA